MSETAPSFLEKVRAVCAKVLRYPPIRKSLEFLLGGRIPGDVRALRATLRLFAFDCLLMAVCITLGVLRVLPGPGWEFREGHTMTWVSFFQLLGTAYFLGVLWREVKPAAPFSWKQPTSVWRVLSWSFYFLAFDELLKFHEHIDHTLHKLLRMKETHLTDHIDDFIVILYGVIVAGFLLYHIREVLRYWRAIPLFVPAAFLTLVTLALDPIGSDKPLLKSWFVTDEGVSTAITWLDVIEESCKVLAEVFILGTVLAALNLAQKRTRVGA